MDTTYTIQLTEAQYAALLERAAELEIPLEDLLLQAIQMSSLRESCTRCAIGDENSTSGRSASRPVPTVLRTVGKCAGPGGARMEEWGQCAIPFGAGSCIARTLAFASRGSR